MCLGLGIALRLVVFYVICRIFLPLLLQHRMLLPRPSGAQSVRVNHLPILIPFRFPFPFPYPPLPFPS